MVKILEKYPDMTFEAARTQANAMLDKAVGASTIRCPESIAPRKQLSAANLLAEPSSRL
jgi:hypothetical protein